MKFLVLSALCSCLILSARAGSYPASYPFEKDKLGVPTADGLPAANPNHKFDETDEGGYFPLILKCDPSTPSFGVVTFSKCGLDQGFTGGPFDFVQGVNFKLPVPMPQSFYNCTAKGAKNQFPVAQMTGDLAVSKGICKDCCKDMDGVHFFMSPNVDQWDTRLPQGKCAEIPEYLYCWMMDPGKDGCNNRLVDGSTRIGYTAACYDIAYLYFTTQCPVWKVTGIGGYITALEVESYRNKLTPSQTVHYYVIHLGADRVCHPLSYYEADAADEVKDSVKKEDDSSAFSAVAGFFAFALLLA